MEKYHATLFYTQPPQNKYSRPPHLNKSQIASSQSVKHTKPVKAPAYTRALPDIGNEECVETVIEHEVRVL